MKRPMLAMLALCVIGLARGAYAFSSIEEEKAFAKDVSVLLENAWKKWQDSVVVNDVNVEGAVGFLVKGGLEGPFFTADDILSGFDAHGKTDEYTANVKTLANAAANGMASWQKGYSNAGIPFPQGASCTFTLPPCNNVPVPVKTGKSSGDPDMEDGALYSRMVNSSLNRDEETLKVFRASARAIAECFIKWQGACTLSDITASGGIAPTPTPMGQGPGHVRGAKGSGGRLEGAYFDGEECYELMIEELKKPE